MMAKQKRCAGVPRLNIEAHDAPVSAFGNDKSSKDGLYRVCKEHDAQYQKVWREARKAGVTWMRPALTVVPEPELEPEVVDGTATQEAEIAALEADVEAVGGPESPEGQVLLAQAAEQAAQARRDHRNEQRRLARARAKAAQATA